MKVGDLVRCIDTRDLVVILGVEHGSTGQRLLWLDCLWPDGQIAPTHIADVEVINESR